MDSINIKGKLKNLNKVEFIDSPFSKIIANQYHINKLKAIASKKLNTFLNTPIAKGIKIELRTWKKFIQKNYIKSLTYKRINEFCDISVNEARKGIYLIDDIKNPNLPLNFDSKEGARLDVGILNEGRMRDRCIDYNNKDKDVLNKILQCSKKVLSKKFIPKIGLDKRNNTYCIYFPPIFAKRYTKLGFTKKNKKLSELRIPQCILDNEAYQKIWWQGNLSEEASVHPLIQEKNKSFYVTPRIQLNRVKSVNLICPNNFQNKTPYYIKNIPNSYLEYIKTNPIKLMLDESNILKNFDIEIQPFFSKIYINKLRQPTATYTILIYKLNDLEKYLKNIGFELKRHQKQLELFLNSRGRHTKEEIRDIIIKFYKLTPKYLRGIKKIKTNKLLMDEDKQELLGDVYDKTTNSNIYGAR